MASYAYGASRRSHVLVTDKGNNMNLNEEDDFGFTFADSEELKAQGEDKVQGLRKMIMPLLNNLMKNPEKSRKSTV